MPGIIKTSDLKKASESYTELYNANGLVVNQLRSGRFEVKCGSTHTYVHNLNEVGEKVNGLALHSFPGSGEEVLSSIQSKLSNQYDLNIVKISGLNSSKEEVVHSIRGTKDTIKDSLLGVADVDVDSMHPGKRYNITSTYGGDYATLIPVSIDGLIELSPGMDEVGELYENQNFNRGDVLYGYDPTIQSEITVLVKEVYPNGAFKDSEGRIYTESDIEIYGLVVGDAAPVGDFREPDTSLFESEDVPSYNPSGDVEEVAPMIGDLANYDTILSSSSDVLHSFMKSMGKVAYLDRASINKISVNAINEDGQATDGSLEYNVTIASPYYKRSSQITVPMAMKKGSVELGSHFITSTGQKVKLTAEAIKAHLGELAGDEEYVLPNVQSVHASVNKADKDIDAVIASTWKARVLDGGGVSDHDIRLGEASEKEDVVEALKRKGVGGEILNITKTSDKTTLPRKLTNEELADIPARWDNSGIDTSKYIPSVMEAYEVDKETYEQAKREGVMTEEWRGKFYIGAGVESTKKTADQELEDTSDPSEVIWYVVGWDYFTPPSSHHSVIERYKEHRPVFVVGADEDAFAEAVENFMDYTVFFADPVSNSKESAVEYVTEQGDILVTVYDDVADTEEEARNILSDINRTLEAYSKNDLPLEKLYLEQYGDKDDYSVESQKKTAGEIKFYIFTFEENGAEFEWPASLYSDTDGRYTPDIYGKGMEKKYPGTNYVGYKEVTQDAFNKAKRGDLAELVKDNKKTGSNEDIDNTVAQLKEKFNLMGSVPTSEAMGYEVDGFVLGDGNDIEIEDAESGKTTLPVIEYYELPEGIGSLYEDGVYKEVADFLKGRGYELEFQSPGELFVYKPADTLEKTGSLSDEEIEEAYDYYMEQPLSKLRKHQDIIMSQIQEAGGRGKTSVFEDLQLKEKIIEQAISDKEFEDVEGSTKISGDNRGWFSFSEGTPGYLYVVVDGVLYSAPETDSGANPGDAFPVTWDSFLTSEELDAFSEALKSETGYDFKQSLESRSSKKTAAPNLTDEQVKFLLEWAVADQNYGPIDIGEYSEGVNEEDIYKSLPEKYRDREALVDSIPWEAIENISEVVLGFDVYEGTDYRTGSRTYALYDPEVCPEKIAKSVARIVNGEESSDDLENLGFSGGEVTDDLLSEEVRYLLESEGIVYINPMERLGFGTDFMGSSVFVADSIAYIV